MTCRGLSGQGRAFLQPQGLSSVLKHPSVFLVLGLALAVSYTWKALSRPSYHLALRSPVSEASSDWLS